MLDDDENDDDEFNEWGNADDYEDDIDEDDSDDDFDPNDYDDDENDDFDDDFDPNDCSEDEKDDFDDDFDPNDDDEEDDFDDDFDPNDDDDEKDDFDNDFDPNDDDDDEEDDLDDDFDPNDDDFDPNDYDDNEKNDLDDNFDPNDDNDTKKDDSNEELDPNDLEDQNEKELEDDLKDEPEDDPENNLENDLENDPENDIENDLENDIENDLENDPENDLDNDLEENLDPNVYENDTIENLDEQTSLIVDDNSHSDTAHEEHAPTHDTNEDAIDYTPSDEEIEAVEGIDDEILKEGQYIREIKEMYDETLDETEPYNNDIRYTIEEIYERVKDTEKERDLPPEPDSDPSTPDSNALQDKVNRELTPEEIDHFIEERTKNYQGPELDEPINNETDDISQLSKEEFEKFCELHEKLEQEGRSVEEIEKIIADQQDTYDMLNNLENSIQKEQTEQTKQTTPMDHSEETLKEIDKEAEKQDITESIENINEEGLHEQKSQQDRYHEQDNDINISKPRDSDQKSSQPQKTMWIDNSNQDELTDEKDKTHDSPQNQASAEQTEKLIEQDPADIESHDTTEQTIRDSETEITIETNSAQDEQGSPVVKKEADRVKDYDESKSTPLQETNTTDADSDLEEPTDDSNEDQTEPLYTKYRQETGKRPLYRGRETKGYAAWLETRIKAIVQTKQSQEIQNHESKSDETKDDTHESESEKINQEAWQIKLHRILDETPNEQLNTELKHHLYHIIQKYRDYDKLKNILEKYVKLLLSSKPEQLSEQKLRELNNLALIIHQEDYYRLNFLPNILAFKDWWDPYRSDETIERFIAHLVAKFNLLKKIHAALNKTAKLNKHAMTSETLHQAATPPQNVTTKPGLQGHHPERRFILKLIFIFLKISPKKEGSIKLPGYFEQHPEASFEGKTAALLELGRLFNTLGGDFYNFGESLFKDTWQKQEEFKQNTIDALEHFILFTRSITQQQFENTFDAIQQYRTEKGFYTRATTPGKTEWDLSHDLQTAFSNQLKRWVSLRELGTIFTGRDASGNPNDDSFFHRRLQGVRQKFRQDNLGELMVWIENPINWMHNGQEYTTRLDGMNLHLARQSILTYNARIYESKNVYLFDENSPNMKTQRIFQRLLLAYSKHPLLNRNFGKKGITFRALFDKIGKYKTFHTLYKKGKPLDERLCKYLLLKAFDDGLAIHAGKEYEQLLTAIKEHIPHWWFATFGFDIVDNTMLLYYKRFEPKMERYYKLALMNPNWAKKYSANKYYDGFMDTPGQPLNKFLKKQQARIMLGQWGGRNPMNGRKIKMDSSGNPLESITAHHYEYREINPLNFFDCRISALIPIPTKEHHPNGEPHTRLWYKRFKLCKEALAEGKIPVPMWWDRQFRLDYIKELTKKGLKNFIKLIPHTP